MHTDGSIAKMLDSLKRFLAERDEAVTFLPFIGARATGYGPHGSRTQDKQTAASAQWATVPIRGDQAGRSVWGTWQ
jgi:hypothetical protein